MRSRLRFFDGPASSRYGLQRGAVALPFCAAAAWLFLRLLKREPHLDVARVGLMALLLCSAVGVQDDDDVVRVFVYGALVFAVVFACAAAAGYRDGDSAPVLLAAVVVAVVIGGVTSIVTNAVVRFPAA